jgi:hypothetical protein
VIRIVVVVYRRAPNYTGRSSVIPYNDPYEWIDFFRFGGTVGDMSDFDLDLQTAEGELDEPERSGRVVLGVLDGSTDPLEWIEHVENDDILVLNVEGDLNELASGFARPVKDAGGDLCHFRGFLAVTPATGSFDEDRLD